MPRCFCVHPDVIQNLLDVCAEGDEREDAHLASTVRADQRERINDTRDQCGPQIVRGWAWFGCGCARLARLRVQCGMRVPTRVLVEMLR